MNKINGIIETALYVEDLQRSVDFYARVLEFESLTGDERFHAFSVSGNHVLLLFRNGSTLTPMQLPGGIIPPHDGSGTTHIGFSVAPGSLPEWEAHLNARGIAIESRVNWERGGESVYFRDPDGHLLELLTPGVWAIY